MIKYYAVQWHALCIPKPSSLVKLIMDSLFFFLVPLAPTNFRKKEFYSVMDILVLFEWDPPSGSGPEAVVESYTVIIRPAPEFHPSINTGLSLPFIYVTLNYSVIYSASVHSINCIGESNVTILTAEYGMFDYVLINIRKP